MIVCRSVVVNKKSNSQYAFKLIESGINPHLYETTVCSQISCVARIEPTEQNKKINNPIYNQTDKSPYKRIRNKNI